MVQVQSQAWLTVQAYDIHHRAILLLKTTHVQQNSYAEIF